MLTISEVASLLDFNPETVRRNAEKLYGVKICGRWRFPADIETRLTKAQNNAGPALPQQEATCPINAKEVRTGISASKEYAVLLGLPTEQKP